MFGNLQRFTTVFFIPVGLFLRLIKFHILHVNRVPAGNKACSGVSVTILIDQCYFYSALKALGSSDKTESILQRAFSGNTLEHDCKQ